MLGTVTGPHPFPEMVRDFHRVIGVEARQQVLDLVGRLPDVVLRLRRRRLQRDGHLPPLHRRPRRSGSSASRPAARASSPASTRRASRPASPACCTAPSPTSCRTRTARPSSRTASRPGLDYPSVGPEHAHLLESGRAEYRPITDVEAMEAFSLLSRTEGILPAIESAHALAGAMKLGRELGPDAVILVNLSGRGDKDVHTAAAVVRPHRRRRRARACRTTPAPRAWGSSSERPPHPRDGAAPRVARPSSATSPSASRRSRARSPR